LKELPAFQLTHESAQSGCESAVDKPQVVMEFWMIALQMKLVVYLA